mmetsp:Transcript_19091/g.28559  ORF Transcript_19091/g.28559 Transcript_19091/m.28559 type:complete len:202 (-) Transcript_19091:440-1045(-)
MQRSICFFASSGGIAFNTSWRAAISFFWNASCISSGRVSKTSIGSKPPGPRRSSFESSTYSYSFPSSPTKMFFPSLSFLRSSSLTLALSLILSAKDLTSSSKPCIFSLLFSLLKNGINTSRGSPLPIDFVRSRMYCTMRYWRTIFFIVAESPFISASRLLRSKKPEQCSCNSSGFFNRKPLLKLSVVNFEYVSSFFSYFFK